MPQTEILSNSTKVEIRRDIGILNLMKNEKIWKTLESEEVFKSKYIRLRHDRCELPDGRIMPRYYVLEFPDWVNVVAVTTDRKLILVRQFRQASGKTHLEIPGGSLDPQQQPAELPQSAAARELEEETGFVAQKWIDLGAHFPNPALQNNRLHTFLALNCQKLKSQSLDPFEDIEVELSNLEGIDNLILSGDINHSLMIASLYRARPYLIRLLNGEIL